MVHHYSRKSWRLRRERVLAEQPICATPGCQRASHAVDHDPPLSQGGSDETSTLRGYCTSCHNRRSALGNATPRAVGCDAQGNPLDPGHWWNTQGSPSRPVTPLGKSIDPADDEPASKGIQGRSVGVPRRSR
jgi:5-methylcytosine-specific restriction enzyme A